MSYTQLVPFIQEPLKYSWSVTSWLPVTRVACTLLPTTHSLRLCALLMTAVNSLGNMTVFQAFPAISTGVYNFPIMSATHIALNAVRLFLESAEGTNVCVIINFHLTRYLPSTSLIFSFEIPV